VGDRTAEDAGLSTLDSRIHWVMLVTKPVSATNGDAMIALARVRKAPGVYLMLDLDEKPVYAGQAENLAKRLKEHLVSQKSDVVTDGLLDVYEVRRVAIWYRVEDFHHPLLADDDGGAVLEAQNQPLDMMEAAVIRHFKPRWNRARSPYAGPISPLTLENCYLIVEVVEGEDLRSRKDALRRIETKLIHLLRAVRKATISGSSRRVRLGLIRHACELLLLSRTLIPRESHLLSDEDDCCDRLG
jgi:hypothetical protein